jgi:hypothetical protein
MSKYGKGTTGTQMTSQSTLVGMPYRLEVSGVCIKCNSIMQPGTLVESDRKGKAMHLTCSVSRYQDEMEREPKYK